MLYHILHNISICHITCYFTYELTVYGKDRNPSLDEGGINIQHNGDRHLARTHSRVRNLKREISLHDRHIHLRNPFYFVTIFSIFFSCVTAKIMRIHQFSIRIQFSIGLDLYFWLELNLMISFRNEDRHLWKQKFWAQKCRKLAFSSFSTLFAIPNRQIIVWMHLVILWIGIADGTFDFDLELKKR